jgi:hypothetical protein
MFSCVLLMPPSPTSPMAALVRTGNTMDPRRPSAQCEVSLQDHTGDEAEGAILLVE